MGHGPGGAQKAPVLKAKDVNLEKMETELRLLADDRDVGAQQATRKIAMALLRLAEVLVHGEAKTSAGPRHHE